MSKTESAIHDIAQVLSDLPVSTPNRHAIFVSTLESLIRYAGCDDALTHARNVRDGLVSISDRQARAARN